MGFREFTDEEAAELNRNTIPAMFFGTWSEKPNPMSATQLSPLLRLDTTTRPDVEAFIEALHGQGLPTARMPPFIYAGGRHPGALLQVDTTTPVPCTFNVFLVWPQDEAVFTLMVASGTVGFFVGKEYDWRKSFGAKVNQDELAKMIRLWKYNSKD